MMLDKKEWAPKKFSWSYAVLMAFAIVLVSFLLLHFHIIESANLRLVYIPIMLMGSLAYMRDFVEHSSKRIGFTKAFVHSFRTGVYTCVVLLPVTLVILVIGLPELGMVDRTGRFDPSQYQTGFMFSKLIEIFATVLISSFLAAFVPGMVKGQNDITIK